MCQMTPFGLPVVPPVYMKSSIGARARLPGRGAVAAYRSASSGASRTADAPPSPGRAMSGAGPTRTRRRSVESGRDGVDHVGREGAAEHQGGGVGVGEKRGEFVLGVAVVGVDWHRAELEGGEHRLQVRRAVVEVARDLVARPDPGRREGGREAGRAVVELRERVVPAGSEIATASGRSRAMASQIVPKETSIMIQA